VPATIARARATLRVGDPVTPAPVTVDYPALLDGPFPIVGYPFETVLAEKIVSMLDRGELTTRERDFADVLLLTGRLSLGADSLASALEATIDYRGSTRRSLFDALGSLGQRRQSNWQAFVGSAGLSASVPASYSEAIDAIIEFADPVTDGQVAGQTWNPVDRHWA
jgi:hypothetical protein